MSIEVECYSGHRADERPRRFKMEDRWLEIRRISKQWREPDAELFEVEADDGVCYRLCHDRHGVWTLDQVGGFGLRARQ